MTKHKLFIATVKDVWNGRSEGTHGWVKVGRKWITIEPEEEDGVDYLNVALVKEIDSLGYPWSKFINYCTLDDPQINDKYILDVYNYLLG